MTFETPTTYAELLIVLKNIVDYYLDRREEYTEPTFEDLDLSTITYTSKTDQELQTEAEQYYFNEYNKKKQERTAELNSKLREKNLERAKVMKENAIKRAEIVKAYSEKINDGCKSSLKSSVYYSSVPADIIEKYIKEKDAELSVLDSALNSVLQCIDAEITYLRTELTNVNTFFANEMSQLVAVKKAELKKAQDEKVQAITKYNNSVEEKMVKYANTMLKEKADLKLKHLEIQGVQLTEDQKVRKGYFSDIIRALDGYYATMTAANAYADFRQRSDMAVYLGSYYTNYLYLMQVRAGT